MKNGYTHETLFLRPLVKILDDDFVNIFSVNQNIPYQDNHYFVIHKNNNIVKLTEFYERVEGYMERKEYKINNEWFYCFTFEITDKIAKYFDLFRENQINKLPKELIEKIKGFWLCKIGSYLNIFTNNYEESSIPLEDYHEPLADLILKEYNETGFNILDN